MGTLLKAGQTGATALPSSARAVLPSPQPGTLLKRDFPLLSPC